MPVYATQQDLIDRFGEDALLVAADRDNDGQIDAAVVNAALADADAEINVYIGQQYQLPLPFVPDVLKTLACNMAFHFLSPEADTATEHLASRYDRAIKLLKQIATGDPSLGMPQNNPVAIKPSITSKPRRNWDRGQL